jgi:hypothetical protein
MGQESLQLEIQCPHCLKGIHPSFERITLPEGGIQARSTPLPAQEVRNVSFMANL